MANIGNTQQQIDYGASANDGTGDPLRTAFIKTDDNFDNVWLAGPVGSNITIVNNTIQANNTNGNLILSPNGIGVVQTNSKLLPRLTNTYDLGSSALKYRAGYFGTGGLTVDGNVSITGNLTAGNISYTSNVFVGDLQGSVFADDSTIMVDAIDNVLYAGRAAISGNVSATYFIGNGSQLTGLAATYGNANVVANLAALGSNPVSTTGNISGNFFVGNGRSLTGITSSYGNANVVANLAALGSNPVSTTGNISGNYFIGNGSQLTGMAASYGNANVVANLAALGSNPVSTTGNVTASYFIGNGSLLTGLPAPAVTQDITSNGAMSLMTYDGVIKYVSYATVEPSSGNIAGGNITTTGLVSAAGNITAGNLNSPTLNNSGNISVVAGGNAWTFGTDGRLINLEGLTLTAGGQFNICTILTGGSGYNTGSALKATTGGSGTGMTVGIGYGLSNQLTNADVVDPGTGYVDGDVITVSGGTSGTFVITRYNDQANQANNNFIESNWVFGNAGNLTLPGNTFAVNYANGNPVVISGGASNYIVNGNSYANIATADGNLVVNVGTDGYGTWTFETGTGNLIGPGNASQGAGIVLSADQSVYIREDMSQLNIDAGSDIVITTNSGNVGNTQAWNFGADGNLTLPGNIIAINYTNGNRVTGNITFRDEIVIGTGTSNLISGLYLAPSSSGADANMYLRVRGNVNDEPTHIHFDTGNNQYYNQFIGDDLKYIQLANTGNIVINSNDAVGNTAQWNFNNFGTLTLPGGSQLRPLGANLDIFAGTSSYVNLITSDESSSMGVGGAGGYVVTAGGTWNFNSNGNLTAPGNISAVGNITGGNIVTSGSGGDITMSAGNITGAGNISAGNVSTTGNVTAANFFGNGNTLSNVATQVTGTWTVPVGNSTQSFTVSNIGTYSMWVDCNITNGILAWNATATVTNNNVPVVGAQYAWVYNGGGTPVDFTSIPNQFTGTANTIVRSSVAPSATTNRFDFGINNTSGNTVTVNYGYTKIS